MQNCSINSTASTASAFIACGYEWAEGHLADGALAAHIEPERLIGGIVYPASELIEPGVVRVIEGNRFTLGARTDNATSAYRTVDL